MTETVGQTIDAEIAVVKARIAVLEAAATSDWSKVKAWFAANALHLLGYSGVAALVLDKIGVVKL